MKLAISCRSLTTATRCQQSMGFVQKIFMIKAGEHSPSKGDQAQVRLYYAGD